jgi:hypothetical protein
MSSNSNNDSIEYDNNKHNAMITKYNTTMNNTNNNTRKRSHILYTSTQETSTPLNYNTNHINHTVSGSITNKSHNKLYNELKRLTKEHNYEMHYDMNDNENEENVAKNEELIINEYKRVLKENKEKDILINKAIALYEASTGQIVNDNMNLQNILFDWIKEMSSLYHRNFIDDKYKNYCESIMHKHNLSNFNELKDLVNHALLMINKKSSFLEGIKKLLLKDPNYSSYDN